MAHSHRLSAMYFLEFGCDCQIDTRIADGSGLGKYRLNQQIGLSHAGNDSSRRQKVLVPQVPLNLTISIWFANRHTVAYAIVRKHSCHLLATRHDYLDLEISWRQNIEEIEIARPPASFRVLGGFRRSNRFVTVIKYSDSQTSLKRNNAPR
jgi:hypothetical protein